MILYKHTDRLTWHGQCARLMCMIATFKAMPIISVHQSNLLLTDVKVVQPNYVKGCQEYAHALVF